MDEKRRLPSWMVGASATSNVSKPLDLDANNVIKKEEVIVVTESTRPNAKGLTRKRKKEDCLPSDEKGFLVKCKTKRKKREFVEKDLIDCRDCEQGVVVEKRKRGRVGRKVEEPDHSRKKGKKIDLVNSIENQASSGDEDDEDLTMDDVLSFAKEFVENDESEMAQQKASERLCESKPSYASSSMTETSLFVRQDTTRSPMHEETASHHDVMEDSHSASEVMLAGSRTTGDAAQDMLDLFLGPLLKKPIPKEDVSSIKDTILPHEVKNQEHDAGISNKPVVTFTKKKSSLRDAVAMFLD